MKYFRGEERKVPYLPLHRKKSDIKFFLTFGKILSHIVILLGYFPEQISLSTYMSLMDSDNFLSSNPKLLLKEFMLFITKAENRLITRALSSFDDLTSEENENLKVFFQFHELYEVPSSLNIENQILIMAEEWLVNKPRMFFDTLKCGILGTPYENIWTDLTVEQILSTQAKTTPTSSNVINCLETEQNLTTQEMYVFHYLKLFIYELSTFELEKLLLFITGSPVMPHFKITIVFKHLPGCSMKGPNDNTLQLSSLYSSYQELSQELRSSLL